MGQKVHPKGFRLGVIESWDSQVVRAARVRASCCTRTSRIRKFLKKRLYHAGISKIEIERAANKAKINIHTARPGIVIGKKGAEIEKLKAELAQAHDARRRFINIHEVRRPDLDAQLVAENVALQLERRVAFRRAMKEAVAPRACAWARRASASSASGRLGGAEIARTRVVPRGARAAAHAARRHQLRLRRGEDHLRRHRRQGVDLPRRGAHATGRGAARSAVGA